MPKTKPPGLKAKFAEVDKDGSGKISLDEFKALLKQGDPNISEASVMTVWKKCDKDGSGKLSYNELADYLSSGDKTDFKNPGMSPACKTFCDVFSSLTLQSDAGKEARAHAFTACDPNGNGYVSLAEVDAWIQKVLQTYFAQGDCDGDPKEEGTRIWKCFRPSYIRAHTDAKDVAGSKTSHSDDYVTAAEFRVLCVYLILYAARYDAFALIDGGGGTVEDKSGDDRRMTLDEWVKGYKSVADHGFIGLKKAAGMDAQAAADIFKKMNSGRDADGKEYGNDNVVMLAEFCAWVEDEEVAAGTAWGKVLDL
jgi:Ca2+-binding EF-hand superfamily protein